MVNSLDDARTHIRRMKAEGAISVKSYNQPRRDQRQQVLVAAREEGIMVVPEGGSLFMHNMTQVVDGHTGIEHALPVARLYDDVVQLWSSTEVGYTPTLGVGYGGLNGEIYWYQESDVFTDDKLQTFVPRGSYEPKSRRRIMASEGDWNHISIAEGCKQLYDAGVGVNLGAHGQREGLAAHWEMWMFEQGGMTPHEALRSSTPRGRAISVWTATSGPSSPVSSRTSPSYAATSSTILRVSATSTGRSSTAGCTTRTPWTSSTPTRHLAPLYFEAAGADGTDIGGATLGAHED